MIEQYIPKKIFLKTQPPKQTEASVTTWNPVPRSFTEFPDGQIDAVRQLPLAQLTLQLTQP